MRAAIICVLVFVATASASDREFNAWAMRYGKSYRSDEREMRFEIWSANRAFINAHNSKSGRTYELALNGFSDLTRDEFLSQRTMQASAVPVHSPEQYAIELDTSDLPSSFDWASPKQSPVVVTPVRDQGTVGSCWAFSTAQNIEGQWALKHSLDAVELSTEQLVDCDNETSSVNINEDCGVFGGWPYLSYQHIISVGGIQSEAKYPYCCGTGACYPCYAPGTNVQNCGPPPTYCNISQNQCGPFTPAATISSWTAISSDETQIAAQLISRGPLSVLLDATWLQFYSKGIFDPSLCSTTELDHAVLITGFGALNGTDYWVVKNSWSKDWGMSGYFWIRRGTGECGINTAVTTAVI